MPRKLCEHCQRPLTVCICPYLVNLQAPCQLLILQHPSEQKQALATVPLLQLCIEPLTVLVGEEFESCALVRAILKEPQSCRVLFPTNDSIQWDVCAPPASHDKIKTLIVIDGTWRKAKRIWHMNPWLLTLPCVHLANAPSSQYHIRSSSVAGGLSTLEAVMQGCRYLATDNQREGFASLLTPFNAMIDMQIKQMGEAVFLAHYGQPVDDK